MYYISGFSHKGLVQGLSAVRPQLSVLDALGNDRRIAPDGDVRHMPRVRFSCFISSLAPNNVIVGQSRVTGWWPDAAQGLEPATHAPLVGAKERGRNVHNEVSADV